jgi:hypothetical protein
MVRETLTERHFRSYGKLRIHDDDPELREAYRRRYKLKKPYQASNSLTGY